MMETLCIFFHFGIKFYFLLAWELLQPRALDFFQFHLHPRRFLLPPGPFLDIADCNIKIFLMAALAGFAVIFPEGRALMAAYIVAFHAAHHFGVGLMRH